MLDPDRFTFRLLSDRITIPSLDCGCEAWATDISDFLREDALVQQQNGLNKTFLVYRDDVFVGYVSLLASSIEPEEDSDIPNVGYPAAPCLLIGRLGIQRDTQRQGIGSSILSWIRGEAVSLHIGVRFLVLHVDRANAGARTFYENNGFSRITQLSDGNTLFYIYDLYASGTI